MNEYSKPDETDSGIRLAIVRQRYNPAGGAERFVSRALDVLRQTAGINVALLARKWETIAGVRAICVAPFYLGNVWRDWGFARAARRVWQQEKFDLVQSHERIPGCDIYRAGDGVHAHWLSLRRRTLGPFGRLSLLLNPYHHYVCCAERRMFHDPQLKLVICNANMVKQEILRIFDLPEERLAVIYNGVDTEAFHPRLAQQYRVTGREQWAIPAQAPLLLYVGSGFERKGVARALAAIVDHPEVHLLIVGNDKHSQHYQTLASKLGVASRVRFCGAQSDVKPFYGMADGFLLPTLYDPFPNVCVEALACGLPVLTSTTCGSAELLENGVNGWVVDALDAPAWSQAVAAWLQARPDWQRLSEAARLSAEPLTLPLMAEKLLTHYRVLLNNLPQ